MEVRHYIIIGNRRFEYVLKPARKYTVLVCSDANIEEEIENSKLPELLSKLPQLIIASLQNEKKQSEVLRFRVTPEEKQKIMQDALDAGFDSVSAYIRYKLLSE